MVEDDTDMIDPVVKQNLRSLRRNRQLTAEAHDLARGFSISAFAPHIYGLLLLDLLNELGINSFAFIL